MIIIAALLPLTACAQWTPFRPVTAPVDDETRATKRAAKMLTADGYTVTSETDGLVTTEWKVIKQTASSDDPAIRWVVTVDGTEAVVDVQCRYTAGIMKDKDCGDIRPPGTDWQAKAAELARRIGGR